MNNKSENENDSEAAMVKLKDGNEVSMDELKKCYRLREKLVAWEKELSTSDSELQQMNNNYEKRLKLLELLYARLEKFLDELIPEEPDENLAKTEPAKYQEVTEFRNQAIEKLKALMDSFEEDQKKTVELRREGMRQHADAQERLLLEVFPLLRDPEERSTFGEFMHAAATKFGLAEEELIHPNDHKFMRVLYYAALGYQFSCNGKNMH